MYRSLALLLLGAALLAAQDDELPAQMKSMIQAYTILEHNAAEPISWTLRCVVCKAVSKERGGIAGKKSGSWITYCC